MRRRNYGDSAADLELARKAVKKPSNFVWQGPSDGSDPDKWALTVSQHRDSGIVDQSNFAVINADMEKRFPDDVEVVSSSHWAVGWIDQLGVRVFDDKGRITDAFHAIVDWKAKLEDYPLADEDDYSRREHEAGIANIVSEVYSSELSDDAPEDWAYAVFEWLWDNAQDQMYSHDDQGAYPDKEYILEALRELGWLKE
jgi:hypothetical protein